MDLEILRVVGDQTRLRGLLLGKADFGVDVQWEVGSAWRPDDRFDGVFICDEVVVAVFALPCGLCLELRDY